MNDLFNLRMWTRMVLEVETALSLIKPMSLSTLSDRYPSLLSLHVWRCIYEDVDEYAKDSTEETLSGDFHPSSPAHSLLCNIPLRLYAVLMKPMSISTLSDMYHQHVDWYIFIQIHIGKWQAAAQDDEVKGGRKCIDKVKSCQYCNHLMLRIFMYHV